MSARSGPGRHEARERAIALIYEAEAKEISPRELVENLPAEPMPYASLLTNGVSDYLDAIDELIEQHADGWRVARMPAVDRALLRVAVYELAWQPDVPVGAILNEAVELAKDYSTESSGRFVNGVLAALAEDLRGHNKVAHGEEE